MSKAKRIVQGKYKDYPEPQQTRCGCKVSWNYYAKKEDADKCAEAAKHNARLQEAKGYDFGYCAPGSVELMREGRFYPGLYEVCIP